MDCNDVELLIAGGDQRTLTGRESTQLDHHVATCEACRLLARQVDADDERADGFRWVVRVPEDALDDPDLLVLPTVDPVVFESGRELARGGMGRVMRARDRRLGRDVAIKEVLEPGMRSRFEREVAITAQLQHPAIVPVYEAGSWPDGSAFYTMRLVSGGTLGEAIAKTTKIEQRLALLPHVLALTDALAYAHSRGIVHRDLKPGNVLVGEFGETVVIDWGLAKELRREIDDATTSATKRATNPDLTIVGSVMGTPGFMAPEQAAGAAIDERADVYSLGAILYNLLAGQQPYAGHGSEEAVELAKTKPPRPVGELAPNAPVDLRAIVERAMSRDAGDRFPSAREMAEELRRFQAGQLLQSREYRLRELIARWVRRHRTAVIVGAIAIVIVVVVGVGALFNITRSRTAAERSRERAEASITTLFEEQGRAHLVAGDPDRALPYLSEAYSRGGNSIALRYLLAEATRDVELQEATIVSPTSRFDDITYRDTGEIVTVERSNPVEVVVWRDMTRQTSQKLDHDYRTAALTPDGKRLLGVTQDGHVELRDVATGARLWRIDHDSDPTIRFDQAGTRVVLVADRDKHRRTAELRDVATGALVATLETGTAEPQRAAFSDDGTRIALCDSTGSLAVWDTQTAARLSLRSGCHDAFAFIDNDSLVVQTSARRLEIWRGDGTKLALFDAVGTITVVRVSARADRIIAADSADSVYFWNLAGELRGTTRATITSLEISPDGTLLASGASGQDVQIRDTSTLGLIRVVHGPRERTEQIVQLAWARNSSRLATLRAGDQRVFTYRRPRGNRVRQTTSGGVHVGHAVRVAREGVQLVARSLETGAVALQLPLASDETGALGISADDRRIAIGASTGGVRVVDASTRATIAKWQIPTDAYVELSADGRWLVEIPQRTAEALPIRVFDVDAGKVVRELALPHGAEASVSPDGTKLSVTPSDSKYPAMIADLATGKLREVGVFEKSPMHSYFDRTGQRAIFYGPSTVRIVDAATASTLLEVENVGASIEYARFDARGDRFVTWGQDRVATVRRADTGAVISKLDNAIWGGLAISDDGTRVVTATESGELRIWDVETGRLLQMLPGDSAPSMVHWSRDGSRLVAVTGVWTQTTVWDVHLETRSPAEIATLAARASTWRLDGGLLVAKPVD